MEFKIRKAVSSDCPRLMELIRELAVFEKAPEEVTVTLRAFYGSRFWKKPCLASIGSD